MESRSFPLSSKAKPMILNTLFDCSLDEYHHRLLQYESYLSYYQTLVEISRPYSITKTHLDIVKIVKLLKDPDATRTSVENALRGRLLPHELQDSAEIIVDSINLGIRLLLMISTRDFRRIGHSMVVSGETKLDWIDGNMKAFVDSHFKPETTMNENVKLEKIFNARNLERIAGIEIRWTNNLVDHLRMRDDDTAVEIFHYASFLRFHHNCNILPPDLISETLLTLSLLLPEHDKDVEIWFERQQAGVRKRRKLHLDPLARECGQLKVQSRRIENFKYWHDRLVILKQVFDEAEPSSIRQWWCDRRRRVQWYTFWVAALVLALTILFGIIQSVEGALQVYLAYRALN